MDEREEIREQMGIRSTNSRVVGCMSENLVDKDSS